MKQNGARPMVEMELEERPVGGVTFVLGQTTDPYIDEDAETARLTGLRAMARRFFRR